MSQELFFIPKIKKRPEISENAVSQGFQNNSKQFQNSKMGSNRETPPPPLPTVCSPFRHFCNIFPAPPGARSLNSEPSEWRCNKFTAWAWHKWRGGSVQRAGTRPSGSVSMTFAETPQLVKWQRCKHIARMVLSALCPPFARAATDPKPASVCATM